jgi:mannan endo-1,4-beta-mannosidase
MQAWVKEMSTYLKRIDPNHLVTVGSEGFWGQNSALASKFNPGGGVGIYDGRTTWAAMTGSNFTAQHNFSSIDFCAAHYWPDMSPIKMPLHIFKT